ncbi:hypothetical protein ACFLSJ_01980 [Verrucomicrobiota bacterium]
MCRTTRARAGEDAGPCVFFITGLAATVRFLVRVIPKPGLALSAVVVAAAAFNAVPADYAYDGTGPGALPDPSAPDTGNAELTNGVLPASPAPADPQWVGFRDASLNAAADHPQVTFQYAATQAFDHIDIAYLHTTNPPDETITAPDSVVVAFSADGMHFGRPMLFSSEFDGSWGAAIRMARLDVTGRHGMAVRLEFRNASEWTYLAEITPDAWEVVSHMSLQARIAEAQGVHDAAVEGNAVGEYPVGARASLSSAIAAARAVDDDPRATGPALAAAEEALADAILVFRRSINGGWPILRHILGTGQSLSVGWNGPPPLSTNQPFANLMLSGVGQTGTNLVPLVEDRNLHGSRVETISSALGNTLTALSPRTNVTSIVTRCGEGGIAYAGLKKGTVWYAKGLDQVRKARAAAVSLPGEYRFSAVTVVHGESDHLAGNGPLYEGFLMEWQQDYEQDIQALTGQTERMPMFLCQMSSHTRYGSATSLIPAAQLSACERSPRHYLVCPKYFLPYSDGVHLNATGYRWLGEYYGKALKRVLVDGQQWEPLKPVRILQTGTNILVDFHVPAPPLVFDTNSVLFKQNYGFEYSDASGSAAIADVSLLDADSILITLERVPTGAQPRLRYAHTGDEDSPAGWDESGSARGNLRDSDATPSLYGSTLWNWLVHFDHPIPYDPARDDFDGDGVPDRWEYNHFGNTNGCAGTATDADGDGVSDYGEWLSGTDPFNDGDGPRIDGPASGADGAWQVSWTSVAGRRYDLLANNDLSQGNWTSIVSRISTGGVMRYPVATTDQVPAFFRFEVREVVGGPPR